jgi:hypothetical protein
MPDTLGYHLTQDLVRWGPIIAGLVTALTSLVLLGLLGAGIGLSTLNAEANAAQGTVPADAGRNSAAWAAISGLVAFFLGGLIAGRTSAVFDRGWGALNGALVFLVAVPFTLLLAGMGFGTMMGFVGNLVQGTSINLGQVQNTPVNPTTIQVASEATRNTAWGALIGGVIALIASILGGMLGTRTHVVHHTTSVHTYE